MWPKISAVLRLNGHRPLEKEIFFFLGVVLVWLAEPYKAPRIPLLSPYVRLSRFGGEGR
jgi:hypothetical protein